MTTQQLTVRHGRDLWNMKEPRIWKISRPFGVGQIVSDNLLLIPIFTQQISRRVMRTEPPGVHPFLFDNIA